MNNERVLGQRYKIFIFVIAFLFAFLVGRLWQLQVVRGDSYQQLAEGNRIRSIPIRAPRGSIFDRNDTLLAANRLAFTVSVVPSGLSDPKGQVLEHLSEILDVPTEQIQETLSNRGGRPYEPIRIKRDVSMETVIAVEEERSRLPGVFVEDEWVRQYPHSEIAGHVLGYLGLASPEDVESGYSPSDLVGKSGLEHAYESFLRGRDGSRRVEVDALSRPIRDLGVIPPEPGMDLQLTLDLDLQRAVSEVLERGLQRLIDETNNDEAGAGAAVVLDPNTGDLLAMASFPMLNSARLSGEDRAAYVNELNQGPLSPWLNRAIRAFPPGSTFKVVTGIAALESGAIEPNTVYNADGRHKYGKADWTIHQGLPPAGPVTIVEALGRSTNDFFWEIALRPETGGIESIAEWARRFGLGTKTGINLQEPSEMPGLVPDKAWKRTNLREPWYEAETMDVAIGQGFLTATPLQLAQLYATVASEGVLRTPRLVRGATSPDGSVTFEATGGGSKRIEAAKSTWRAMREGLRATAQWHRGTAYNAFRGAEYDPAGKTGSSQTGREAHGWFAGFAPSEDPEIVVVVFAEYGGSGAQVARIAREIFDVYFNSQENAEPTT